MTGRIIMHILKKFISAIKNRVYIFKNTIKPLEMVVFYRQFATLISSNIPITQCLDMLYQTQQNVTLKTILLDLKYNLERGNHLSTSLRKFSNYFDHITCFLLAIGEKSGTFDLMLQHIANHKEKAYRFNHKIKQSLFYPAIISLIAIFVCLIMLLFVVPRFSHLFQEANVSLPTFTLIIIHFSEILQQYGFIFLTPFILIFFSKEKLRSRQLQNLVYNIPIIGSTLKIKLIINFTRYLSITLKAGLAISESIPLIAKASGNISFENDLMMVKQYIELGHKINNAMRKNPGFPVLMIEMIKIGEESGTLDDMLEKISILYENELDQLTSYLSDLLEPLIMVILGVLIGGLVIAMYLPIFKLGTAI